MDRTMNASVYRVLDTHYFWTQTFSPLLFQVCREEVEGDEGGLSALSIVPVSSP